MKQYRNQIATGVIALIVGVLIGALFFGGNPKIAVEETGHDHNEEQIEIWTCSMHPQIRQNEPGNCPICGMELIPLSSGAGSNPYSIQMSERAMQLADIQTTVVGSGSVAKTLSLTGKVQEDERRVYNQTAHFPGRIEELYVNFTGEYVKKGQKIASVYSPEMVTAQEELLEALKFGNNNLIQSARKKLKLWKLSDAEIAKIEVNGKVITEVPVTSDVSGVVISKEVSTGSHLMQGGVLYKVADLSSVWVVFDAYESQLQWIKIGDEISFQVPSAPGKSFKSKVSFIDAVINPATRVALVRVQVQNKEGLLKPEMLVNGTLKKVADANAEITVPKSAVMWTGKRSVVYVKLTEGNETAFLMREVTLGAAINDGYVIVDGLSEGEEIVTNGTFSVDAAAQLQGKKSMMNPEGGPVNNGHDHSGNTNAANNNHVSQTATVTFKNSLTTLAKKYLDLKDALVNSDPKAAQVKAAITLKSLDKIPMNELEGEQHGIWMPLAKAMEESLKAIATSTSLEVQRQQFENVSNNITTALQTFGIVGDVIYEHRCPMANKGKGAIWLSSSTEVRNPYYGEAMLQCGEVIFEIKPEN